MFVNRKKIYVSLNRTTVLSYTVFALPLQYTAVLTSEQTFWMQAYVNISDSDGCIKFEWLMYIVGKVCIKVFFCFVRVYTNNESWRVPPGISFTPQVWQLLVHINTKSNKQQTLCDALLPVLFFLSEIHIRKECTAFFLCFCFLHSFQHIISVLSLLHLSLDQCPWTVIFAYPSPPGPTCRNNEHLCPNIILLQAVLLNRGKTRMFTDEDEMMWLC